VETGYDMGLSEAEMYECVHGHTVCESHTNFSDEAKEKALMHYLDEFDFDYYLKEGCFTEKYGKTKEEVIHNIQEDDDLKDDFMSDYMEIRYNLPAEICPICNLDSLQDDDKLYYLLKKNNIDIKDLEKTIREEFKTHGELLEYIKD
jgi:hypothetical protein